MGPDLIERLRDIERVLAQDRERPVLGERDTDPVAVHLADVPAARIRDLTAALSQRSTEPLDQIDAIALRLLLSDYTVAVAHLRAVAQIAASSIDAASADVEAGRKFVMKEERRLAAASTLPPIDSSST